MMHDATVGEIEVGKIAEDRLLRQSQSVKHEVLSVKCQKISIKIIAN